MLSQEHKLKRVDISRTLLTQFQANPKNFPCKFVIRDENLVHLYEPESNIQIKQFKQVASVDKVIVSVYFLFFLKTQLW